jgi:pimeloyl-ACP methyl ester carboxylesterase
MRQDGRMTNPRRLALFTPSRRVALAALALAAGAALTACTSVTSSSFATGAGGTDGASAGASSTATAGASSGASSGADGTGTPAVVPEKSTLHWSACGGTLGGAQCASLAVPLNYADPGGRTITLALSMIPATAPVSKQQGVLLVNPGGPGAPGRSLAGAVAAGLSPQVAATYDIVGFDPRGVGGSVPALSCDPGFATGVQPDYIPASAAAEQVLIDRARAYAAGCEQRYGWLLPYLTTVNSARDMDAIRQAFGVQKINYYAFSYGTYLGQVYGTLFPGRVRRMVLDSTVDPTGAWYNDNIEQDYAFQGRMDAFFAWTAKYDSEYHLGTTGAQVEAAYYKVRAELAKNPIQSGGVPLVGPDELDNTFVTGGYLTSVWPGFAAALSQYVVGGNGSGLADQYQQWGTTPANEFAIYNAVECADVNWPRNWAKWQADTERVYRTAPFEAWDNAWFNAACAFWPFKGPAEPFTVNGSGLPPILMLQGTLDPATPYAGAQNAHRLLPSARMVVVEGGGDHGQSLETPPNACVQNYLNAYLATGAVPDRPGLVNATCPAPADPTPGG